MHAECRLCPEVDAFVTGELEGAERTAFERHLADCARCRLQVAAFARVVSHLRSLPPVEMSADLVGSTLSAIREKPERSAMPWMAPALAAAAAVMIFVGLSVGQQPTSTTAPAMVAASSVSEFATSQSRALAWFVSTQESDGSWDAVKWGGTRRFQPALTALPLIALLEAERTPERLAAIARGVHYLRSQQNEDGTFGEPFREGPFLQGICTLALVKAYAVEQSPELLSAVNSALMVVLREQRDEGAWGYQRIEPANLSITLWHKAVVDEAANLGWAAAKTSAARVQSWLAEQPRLADSGTLQCGDRTDFHRAYFAAMELRGGASPAASRLLAEYRRKLCAAQSANGEAAGTWDPVDQWSRVGGRIYTTALASLTLR